MISKRHAQKAADKEQGESAPQADEADTPSSPDTAAEQAGTSPQPDEPVALSASDLAHAEVVDKVRETENPAPPTDPPLIRPKRMVFTKNQA